MRRNLDPETDRGSYPRGHNPGGTAGLQPTDSSIPVFPRHFPVPSRLWWMISSSSRWSRRGHACSQRPVRHQPSWPRPAIGRQLSEGVENGHGAGGWAGPGWTGQRGNPGLRADGSANRRGPRSQRPRSSSGIAPGDTSCTGPSRPDAISGVSLVSLRMLVRVLRRSGGGVHASRATEVNQGGQMRSSPVRQRGI